MLERALSRTFTNLSTLVLIAFVFTLPVHLVQAYLFRDVLAVQELGPEISALPEGRLVRGVDEGDFRAEQIALAVAIGLDLLLLPLAYRASRRAYEIDNDGGVPTVIDSWRHPGSLVRPDLPAGPLLVTAVVGSLSAMLVMLIGNLLANMASADFAWVVFGFTRGTALGLLVALITGVAAAAPERTTKAPAPEKIDFY